MKIVSFLDETNQILFYRMRILNQIIKTDKTSWTFSSRNLFWPLSIRSRFYDVIPYIESHLGKRRIETRKIRRLKTNIMAVDIKYQILAEELLGGALRGVIILHETYGLNLERFIQGELLDNNALTRSRKTDSLKKDDLALMAVEAFKMNWYDSSIKYINSSTSSHHHLSEQNQDYYNFPKFKEISLEIRRHYAKHHNNLLVQSKTTTDLLSEGIEWKLFPHFVDEGLNTNITYFIINKYLLFKPRAS